MGKVGRWEININFGRGESIVRKSKGVCVVVGIKIILFRT